MNAMQIAIATTPKTIGELKQYLAELEAAWTEEDTAYLGSFNEQALYIGTPQGIGHAYMQYLGGFGLVTWINE